MDTVLNLIFPLLTLVVTAACALLLVSQKTLRDSRDDFEKRMQFLEGKSERDDKTIQSQAAEITLWSKTVTGEVHLVAITDLLSRHHDQATEQWAKWEERFAHIEVLLERLVDATEKRSQR